MAFAASNCASAPETVIEKFVAQTEQARRFQPDDRNAALHVRQQRIERAPRLDLGFVDQPRGKKRAPATQAGDLPLTALVCTV